MNEPIKYMITGALIAVVSGVAGGLTVGVTVQDKQSPRSGIMAQTPMIGFQPGISGSSQRQFPSPGVSSSASGIASKVSAPHQTMPSFVPKAIQEAQSRPEVKAAHEAYMEAQKKYVAAMKSAMDAGKAQTAVASVPSLAVSPSASTAAAINDGSKTTRSDSQP